METTTSDGYQNLIKTSGVEVMFSCELPELVNTYLLLQLRTLNFFGSLLNSISSLVSAVGKTINTILGGHILKSL